MDCKDEILDINYTRYVAWSENPCLKALYSRSNIALISRKITELTQGLDPQGRLIVVPDDTICNTIDGVFQSWMPRIGDIYSRLNIPTEETGNIIQSIINQTIEVIVSTLKNEYEMAKINSKLSAWVQVYGDFNTSGLRAHPIIKVQENRPATMQFNMNY